MARRTQQGDNLVGVFAATLPWVGIGSWQVRNGLHFELSDLALLAATPWLLWQLYRQRGDILRSPLAVLWLVLTACNLAGEFPHSNFRHHLPQGFFVVSLGCLTAAPKRRAVVCKALLVGGFVSLSVSLVGYVWSVVHGVADGAEPFVFRAPFLGLSSFPRLSGTLAYSPERYAEYLLLLGVATLTWKASSHGWAWLQRLTLTLLPLALLLTASYAAVVGACAILVGLSVYRRWAPVLRFASIGIAGAVLVLSCWLVNFGRPTPLTDTSLAQGVALTDFDFPRTYYYFTETSPEGTVPKVYPQLQQHLYRSLTTTYWQAKLAAWHIASQAWPWGAGYAGYPARSLAYGRLHDTNPNVATGAVYSNAYDRPHCAFLSSLAYYGALGALAWAAWCVGNLFCFFRVLRQQTLEPILFHAGIIMFLVVGINLDILENRSYWLLVALAIGAQLERESRR